MWIERLEVAGFKRLAGTYQFDPGLTVVVGPNEAGKSSLGEALVRSVWGFSRSERRRREDISAWERCRPWNGEPWRLVATIVDHEGRRLRAEWDFAEPTVRLLDAVTGDDLSAHVEARRGEVSLGPNVAGITLSDFWQVCAFDQHTLSEVQRSDSLVNALQRSVESVETEVGVSDADGRLRDFLNAQIGARSDSYRPLPAGPLQRDRNERDRLAEQIEDAEQEAVEIAQLAHDLGRRRLQQEVLQDERLEVERGVLAHEAADASAICDEAARQQNLVATAPGGAAPDERLVTDARQHFGALDQTDRAIEQLAQRVALAGDEVVGLQAQEADLARRLEALAPAANVETRSEQTVRELSAALQNLVAEPEAQEVRTPEPDARLERYRAMRGDLLQLAGQPEVSWDMSRVGLATALAITSIALGALVSPVALAGLVLAGLAAATARTIRTGSALVDRLRDEFGVHSLDELERAVRDEDLAIAQARADAEAVSATKRARAIRREQLETELSNALDRVSASSGSIETRASRYLADCNSRHQLEQEAAHLNDVRLQLQQRTEPQRELTARRQEQEAQRLALVETLGELGIDASDLRTARSTLDERVREARALAEREASAAGAQEALDALLAGRTVPELEAELAWARQRLEDHKVRFPAIQAAEGDLAALRLRLADADRRLSDASNLAAALGAQIAERESRLPSLPELRERVAALDLRVESRERALEAIRIAREELQEAARLAHRNFAPHLQRALERSLPLFTANRYREVMIGDDLSISVIAPETGSQVPADCLSYGTQDQIYLVQRLEIARMLIPSAGPVPLLLDEPFAEFDEDRERSAVRLLCREAEERQIVVFSNDRRLIDLVRDVQGEPHVIELTAPATTVAVA